MNFIQVTLEINSSMESKKKRVPFQPLPFPQEPLSLTPAEQDDLMRLIFPEQYGIAGCSIEDEVPPTQRWRMNDPPTEFQSKLYRRETPILLKQMPTQLACKITAKLSAISFTRMARTGTFMKDFVNQPANNFNIHFPHALILRGHQQYNIPQSVTVMKDRSKSPLHDVRDPEVKLYAAQWSSVKFFSFNEVAVKCDVELYRTFRHWLSGRSVGCIYEQNTWVPYDYIKMFRPRKLRINKLDPPLSHIIKNLDVQEIICTAGVDPVVDTEEFPYLAKLIRFQCLNANPLNSKFAHFIEYLYNHNIGKLMELHITSELTFEELMPKSLLDKGVVWGGSMIRTTDGVENRSVCAMFRTIHNRNCVVFGLESKVYVFAFDVDTIEDVLDKMKLYPFMFNQDTAIKEPLMEFITKFLEGY